MTAVLRVLEIIVGIIFFTVLLASWRGLWEWRELPC